ncbi:hypothetical protein ACFZAM_20610 [Streptomyces sp. NPDC008079]|uniref:hypothetical protein n=1 Tax=Streptomyces sp. NPDC008079 TaxID=3364806 RepID=UPI0036E901F1
MAYSPAAAEDYETRNEAKVGVSDVRRIVPLEHPPGWLRQDQLCRLSNHQVPSTV